jgi:hypothetical protein
MPMCSSSCQSGIGPRSDRIAEKALHVLVFELTQPCCGRLYRVRVGKFVDVKAGSLAAHSQANRLYSLTEPTGFNRTCRHPVGTIFKLQNPYIVKRDKKLSKFSQVKCRDRFTSYHIAAINAERGFWTVVLYRLLQLDKHNPITNLTTAEVRQLAQQTLVG